MKTFDVVITRTYRRTISVEAHDAKLARKQVEDYGVLEAMNDYPSQLETDGTKIVSVSRRK